MTNVNAKPSLISQTAMTQAKSWVLWTNWNDFQLKLWCQRPGILSVQRGGGWTLSNFMLFNSADAWPVPLLVARHRHSLSSRKFLCGTPEEFIDGGAEVSLRKRKWVGRSIVSQWIHYCLSVDGGVAEVVFSTHHHSGGNQVDPRACLSLFKFFGKHRKPQTACLSSRREVGVSGQSCS